MPSEFTTLEELALDLVKDDYESAANIEEQVKLLLGNGVSRQQITGALAHLRELGLVEAFLYRETDRRFERFRRPKLKAGVDVWWQATDTGRQQLAGSS